MDYSFPFKPYNQQLDLMDSIYFCIQTSSIGLFESPTGTGKSLSVACAAITHLLESERQVISTAEMASSKPAAVTFTDWIQDLEKGENSTIAESQRLKEGLREYLATRTRLERSSSRQYRHVAVENQKISRPTNRDHNHNDEEDEFRLDNFDSDEEGIMDEEAEAGYSNESLLRLPQLLYVSRTHTQISQFVEEFGKANFMDLRCVTLGSRRNLCVNASIQALKSDSRMAEECSELQKTATQQEASLKKRKQYSSEGCPFRNKVMESRLADQILTHVQDVEDLYRKGVETSTCSYYASRAAIKDAQIICMPYSMLLSPDVRSSINLTLEGRVIIFDEAHNLVETLNQLNSAVVTLAELDAVQMSIRKYLTRFQRVLNAKNTYYSNLLLTLATGIRRCLEVSSGSFSHSLKPTPSPSPRATDVSTAKKIPSAPAHAQEQIARDTEVILKSCNEFLMQTELDNINVFKLLSHIEEVQLVNKIGGYADHVAKRAEEVAKAETLSVAIDTSRHQQQKMKPNPAVDSAAVKQEEPRKAEQACGPRSTQGGGGGKGGRGTTFTGSLKKRAGENEPPSSADLTQSSSSEGHTSALRRFVALLKCLGHPETVGRLVMTKVFQPTEHEASKPTELMSRVSTSGTQQTEEAMGAMGAMIGGDENRPQPTGPITKGIVPKSARKLIRDESSIKFVMLDPCELFRPIVEQARSVVFLGGTMQPFSYMISQLLRHVPRERLRVFSCGHVVPPSSVCAFVVRRGPSGRDLELTHRTRSQDSTVGEIHAALLQISRVVPHGLVVFFTSYAYMSSLLAHWRRNGFLQQLHNSKPVFVEPRGAAELESVWKGFSRRAGTPSASSGPGNGATLFCVMGGKLSEGINFSDELARCVVVVGMPYPDRRDPILQLKLEFADKLESQMCAIAAPASTSGTGSSIAARSEICASDAVGSPNARIFPLSGVRERPSAPPSITSTSAGADLSQYSHQQAGGNVLYDAMCMRVVNQSIGRAIRHAGDFAAIVLLDTRFAQDRIRAQLPGWIGERVRCHARFEESIQGLEHFFRQTPPSLTCAALAATVVGKGRGGAGGEERGEGATPCSGVSCTTPR